LANHGIYVEPSIFTTITTFDGQLLVKNAPEEHKVVDPEVAYVVTDMLESVITEGTGGVATLPKGMPVAGKTGTTNSAYDAWFVGYTPYYVGATYIGDDAGRKDDSGNTIKRRE
ncbi:penicillin-binding protein, partial [Clostridioides difficile]|nr:penicillin-binding protein [Clostridioides difficile]